MATERNIFQALNDYFARRLDAEFSQDNRFGDVVEDYGNEALDIAKAFVDNAGQISFGGIREKAPDMLQPYIMAPAYLSDMAAAGLFGAFGGYEKAVAALAEGIGYGTQRENRIARDILGGLEAAGANPEARMLGILSPYAQQYIKSRIPDYQYAGRSLLEGDLGGVKEAFTETDMLPKALSADVPKSAEEIRKLYADGQRVVKETPTGFYTQDGTFKSYRSGVERYSPSVRAAENLPQNKGSYEQLREWMVKKGGANLDELQWTGADSKFSGKDVTKEELVNYLNSRTPIIKEDTLTSSGTIGANPPSSEEMLEEFIESKLPDEIQYYKEEVIPEMLHDDERYLQIGFADTETLQELSRRSGWTIDELRGEGSSDPKIMNMPFNYIDMENSMRIRDADELADSLYDVEQMAYDSLLEQASSEGLYSDPEYFYSTMLGKGTPDDYYDSYFDEGDTQYSEYIPAGGSNYTEKVYSLEDYDNLVRSPHGSGTVINDNVDMESASHFTDYADGIVSHARTASYPRYGYEDESIYLFGEGQSDVGQRIRRQKQRIAKKLEALPTYTDEEMRQYAENVGVTPEYYKGLMNRERAEIQNELRIRSRDQMVALNNYEQSVKDVYNNYNAEMSKRMDEFQKEFGSQRDTPNIRNLDDSDSYYTFLNEIEESGQMATKLNNEKIEADFRRRYRIAKNNALDSNDSISSYLLVGDLDADKKNWFDRQNVLFELFEANALDTTNHTRGNPNALKGYENYPVRTTADNQNPMSNNFYDPNAHFFNNYVLNNKSKMMEFLKDAVGLKTKESVHKIIRGANTGRPAASNTEDQQLIAAVRDVFNRRFVQNNQFEPLNVDNMTISMFEDITSNLSLPSLKKYTEAQRKARVKIDVDVNALEQSDDYKKAFPMSDVQSGTMDAFLNAQPQDSINYVNLPPLTESTNKWLDMTLKNNLYDAIQSGDEWFALPNAIMVAEKTGGKIEGHRGFYEGIAPKRLLKILKQIDKDAKLEPINLETTDPKLIDKQGVLGFRLTDEFIKKAYEKGIPQLGVVGGVGLMDFMVRDNKDGRNDSLLAY